MNRIQKYACVWFYQNGCRFEFHNSYDDFHNPTVLLPYNNHSSRKIRFLKSIRGVAFPVNAQNCRSGNRNLILQVNTALGSKFTLRTGLLFV